MKNLNIVIFFTASLLLFACDSINKNNPKDVFADFMVNNLIATQEFSLPSYFPLEDDKSVSHSVGSIFENPLLVFRFSEFNCDICIQAEMALINQLHGENNIVGLASYSNRRMLKLAIEKFNIKFPVYFLSFTDSKTFLPARLEEPGVPYLFLMDTELRSKHVFIPDKQFPEVSTKYYRSILNIMDSYQPQLVVFENPAVDLGTIKNHKTHEIRFIYTNKSSTPLVINDVQASCGCTVPQWSKDSLERNKSSEIIASFTPDALGYNSKIVMVYHNHSNDPIKLFFKANVVE